MVGSIPSGAILHIRKFAAGTGKLAGWTASFIPDLAPLCSQIKDHSKWVKRWIIPLDTPRIIARLQQSEDLGDVLVRGSDCVHSGVKIFQLFQRFGLAALSAAGTLLMGRVTLLLHCIKKTGAAVFAARGILTACYSQNGSIEELRIACIRLGRKIHSLLFFLFMNAIAWL